jgi:hypothetical protein
MFTADLPLQRPASSAAVYLALLAAIGLTSIAFGQPVTLDINSTINNPITAASDSCTISDNQALTINGSITNNNSANCILLDSGRNNTKLIHSGSNGTTWNGGARNRSTARNLSVAAGRAATSIRPFVTFTCPAGGTCWVGGTSGAWSTSGNWSNGVPTGGTNVLIDSGNANAQGASAVTLDIGGAQAANVTVDADDRLSFNNGTSLTVNGTTISNAGGISLNSGGNLTDLILAGNNTVTLSGGGTVTLGNNPNNRLYSSGGGGRLINQETIQGGGQLGVGQTAITNSGTINANVANALIVAPSASGVTNTGTMEASGGGTLDLRGGYTNTGGLIEALAGSTVAMDGATIVGGTLTTSGGGLMESVNTATFNGITLSSGSTYTLPNGTNTVLQGTITNKGNFQLNSGGNLTDLILAGNTTVTLSGGGTVTLGNNPNNRLYSSGGGGGLVNQQTIQGAGQLGVGQTAITNSGTINANAANALIVAPSASGVTNTGTMEASGGGTLDLRGGYTNTGGLIEALAGSTVEMDGATITGGTLTTSGGGLMESVNTVTFNGITLSSGSTYTLPNGTSTVLQGTITNKGNFQLNSAGNLTDLRISGPVTLTGGGAVTMDNNPNNRIYALNGTDTLTNGETIQGAGQLGVGLLTLVNQGTIEANVAPPSNTALLVQPGSGGATNTGGILEATNGATLQLSSGTFNNANGTIQALNAATPSVVLLTGATLNGGTLTTTGNGIMESGSTATLNGVTLSSGSTYTLPNGTNTVLQGTITNLGKFQLNSGGNLTDLILAGNTTVTLSGGGTVTLGNNPNNRLYSSGGGGRLINQETIQGGGQLGVGQTAITNSGTINANVANALIVAPSGSGVTNTGTMEASGGGTLDLRGGYTNTGGLIEALAGSTVAMDGATINGGTLTTSGGGLMESVNTATFNGITLSSGSTYTLPNGTSTVLQGTITNKGNFQLNSAGNLTDLRISGPVTLTGGGAVTMDNNPNNRIYALNGTDTLTNAETIQGAGQLGVGLTHLINNGTILANQPTPLLVQSNGAGITNSGTLSVSASDLMHVSGGPFSNFAGTSLTGGTYNVTGTLQIDELGSSGGEIVTNAANIVLNTPASIFIDAAGRDVLTKLNTNATNASFTITGGRNFMTAGSFTNNGTLTVGAATSKFDVNGSLTNFSGTTLTGGTYNISGTLQFNNANIVTNAANITLTGTSSKIINQSGANGLGNFATNAATGSFAVAAGRTLSSAGAFTNNGALTTTGTGSEFTAGGNFINNKSLTTTGGDSEVATISSARFTNNGTLTIGGGSKFATGGSLSNFSGTTLTGGVYNVSGTLQFTGANIVTSAASISLTGSGSKIVDQTGTTDGLRNFATNSAGGSFSISGGRNFTTVGTFTNAGTLSIGTGSTFKLGGLGNFTQTAGKTTDDGTLSTSGMVGLTGGSLFGKGSIAGALQSAGVITPGDSSTSTGVLSVSKIYGQTASGALDIAIGGTTAGTKYDQLNIAGSASLNGTLNLSLINGFVPAVGTTFEILNAGSVSGTFSAVHGTAINGSEHFVVSCDATDCDVTVASGAAISAKASLGALSTRGAALPGWRTSLSNNLRTAPAVSDFHAAPSGIRGTPVFVRNDLRLAPDGSRAPGAAWMRPTANSAQFPAFSPRPDAGGILHLTVRVREAARDAGAQAMLGNSTGAPRVKSDAAGLRNRMVVGSLSWSLSKPLSKPKPGLAVY